MMRSRLKKTVAGLLTLGIVAGVVIAVIAMHKPTSVFDATVTTPADFSAESMRHGAYLARLGDCIACHSVQKNAPFSGGLAMNTPMGTIYSTNITPDRQTGIGAYSLGDFDRALRHGVAKDGHRLYPAMPYPSYAKLSDGDVRAMYAYFMKGVPAAHQENNPGTIPWPLNMRWPLAWWNIAFTQSGTYLPKSNSAEQTAVWNRGAYLVQSAAHCGACHTARGPAMNEKALDESSPQYLSGGFIDGWFAPSLRQDANTGLGRWSEDDIYRFLKTGRNTHAVAFGSMTEVINNSTQFMSEEDLRAISVYLKSLSGGVDDQTPAWKYDPSTSSDLAVNKRLSIGGAQTYMARCSACHGANGQGNGDSIPPLAGAASMMTKDDSSSINVTLNGSGRIVVNGMPDAYHMPAYRNQLSDEEIADVLSFVRRGWGNQGEPVKSEAVRALRGKTKPSNGTVVVLQAP